MVDAQKLFVKPASEERKMNRKCFLSGEVLTLTLLRSLNILYLLYLNHLFIPLLFFRIYKQESEERPPKEDKIICNPVI